MNATFHAGERAVQDRYGLGEKLAQVGPRMVRDAMPDEHRELFEKLGFIVLGSADTSGALWASLLAGPPGFVRAPTPVRLRVGARPLTGDPLSENLRPGAPLGVLGIELATRRRNRANGHVLEAMNGEFELAVDQSFGNCKKYIQARSGAFADFAASAEPTRESAQLSERALAVLANADTAFIATSSRSPWSGGAEGLDVSHRGGLPGFLHATREGDHSLLTMPDLLGNFMFNTLGNLEVDPRAGLLVVDFTEGDLLSLSGEARVVWEGPEVDAVLGAERLVEFRASAGWLWEGAARGWSPPTFSTHLAVCV
jgi:uncharacterized protein